MLQGIGWSGVRSDEKAQFTKVGFGVTDGRFRIQEIITRHRICVEVVVACCSWCCTQEVIVNVQIE
ncbi:CLUMA_CG020035, isoform A [Clunio marinus]|uniref:CLUMA_CG020035, isoform A n=1 Tax=Clunio marinus TaxID=568069 RepID=A0A1J1J3D6_9DIPT|nr:CLUMA_CG020035, isoform A [Clunio marinus]